MLGTASATDKGLLCIECRQPSVLRPAVYLNELGKPCSLCSVTEVTHCFNITVGKTLMQCSLSSSAVQLKNTVCNNYTISLLFIRPQLCNGVKYHFSHSVQLYQQFITPIHQCRWFEQIVQNMEGIEGICPQNLETRNTHVCQYGYTIYIISTLTTNATELSQLFTSAPLLGNCDCKLSTCWVSSAVDRSAYLSRIFRPIAYSRLQTQDDEQPSDAEIAGALNP